MFSMAAWAPTINCGAGLLPTICTAAVVRASTTCLLDRATTRCSCGPGVEQVSGNRGSDEVRSMEDGRPDYVNCGRGRDVVTIVGASEPNDILGIVSESTKCDLATAKRRRTSSGWSQTPMACNRSSPNVHVLERAAHQAEAVQEQIVNQLAVRATRGTAGRSAGP
jgi:hypothetical protein